MNDPRWLEHLALVLGYRWRLHQWPDTSCIWKAVPIGAKESTFHTLLIGGSP